MLTLQQALHNLLAGENLSAAHMYNVMQLIMKGAATDAQIAGFLIALRCKGESVDEITAAAQVMRELASPIHITGHHLIDTCGTGGDGANTFNISTTCAFVVAAAGGQVAKHGNRSVSSVCGSADVLEAAGVNLALSPDQVAQCVAQIGVGFLFAPAYHPAMRYTRTVRQQLGVRTLFNLLGPLVNPATAPHQLIGVFAERWLEPIAQVLQKLGSQHVLVVHADDGLDELSIASTSHIAELKNGKITRYSVSPEQFGLPRGNLTELAVHDAASSLAMLTAVLDNQAGTARDIVLLNAGAAIYAADLTESLAAGIDLARSVLADGAARAKFSALVAFSQALS